MKRYDLRKIAKETLDITNKRYYDLNGIRVDLVGTEFNSVTVLSPESLKAIEDDDDEFFEQSFWGTDGAKFSVFNCDSFEAASMYDRPLVMNFANAIHVGGGFLNGARAQEESLCRCSTLYASISSDAAAEMYNYNQEHLNPIDSDYLLLSRDVCVFRDKECNLLDNPFKAAVLTIPAPNRNGRAKNVTQEEIDVVMKSRLRKMFFAAARYGYRNLILGAWGCGAFGHTAKRVASYYYELFFEEGFNEFFENVVFAILGDEEKIIAFQEIFGDKLEGRYNYPKSARDKFFAEAILPVPVCNHSGAGSDNIGYTVGIFSDGVPFEAEYWKSGEVFSVGFIMPYIERFHDCEGNILKNGNLLGFATGEQLIDKTVLCDGMVDEGEEESIEVIQKYVDYLCDMGAVEYCTDMFNGTVQYLIDILGNSLVNVKITLRDSNGEYAKSSLKFRTFPNSATKEKKPRFEVIRNGK